jgi:hypothetical protein
MFYRDLFTDIQQAGKASICRNKSSEICQESPICARALWNWGEFCNVLIVVLYHFYGKQQGCRKIRIRIPDADIFFILLHYALELQGVTILFDTGTGNKKRLIDIAN